MGSQVFHKPSHSNTGTGMHEDIFNLHNIGGSASSEGMLGWCHKKVTKVIRVFIIVNLYQGDNDNFRIAGFPAVAWSWSSVHFVPVIPSYFLC